MTSDIREQIRLKLLQRRGGSNSPVESKPTNNAFPTSPTSIAASNPQTTVARPIATSPLATTPTNAKQDEHMEEEKKSIKKDTDDTTCPKAEKDNSCSVSSKPVTTPKNDPENMDIDSRNNSKNDDNDSNGTSIATPSTSPVGTSPPSSSHPAASVTVKQQYPRSQNPHMNLSTPISPSTPVAPSSEIETRDGFDTYAPVQNFTFTVNTGWFYSHVIVSDYKTRAQPDRWHRDANTAIYDLLGNAPQFPSWVSIAIREKQCYWGIRPGPRSENGRRHWYVKLTCRPGCPNTYQLYGNHAAFENGEPATMVWCEFAGDGRCMHRAGEKPRKRIRPNRRRGEGPFGSSGFPGYSVSSASTPVGTPTTPSSSPFTPIHASNSAPITPASPSSNRSPVNPLKRQAHSLETPVSPSAPSSLINSSAPSTNSAPNPQLANQPTQPSHQHQQQGMTTPILRSNNSPSKRPRPTLLTAPAYLNAAVAAQPVSPSGPPGFLFNRFPPPPTHQAVSSGYHYLGPVTSSPLAQSPLSSSESDDPAALFTFVFSLFEDGILTEREARFLSRLAVERDHAVMVIWKSVRALEDSKEVGRTENKRVKMFLFGVRARFGTDLDALRSSSPPPPSSSSTITANQTTAVQQTSSSSSSASSSPIMSISTPPNPSSPSSPIATTPTHPPPPSPSSTNTAVVSKISS